MATLEEQKKYWIDLFNNDPLKINDCFHWKDSLGFLHSIAVFELSSSTWKSILTSDTEKIRIYPSILDEECKINTQVCFEPLISSIDKNGKEGALYSCNAIHIENTSVNVQKFHTIGPRIKSHMRNKWFYINQPNILDQLINTEKKDLNTGQTIDRIINYWTFDNSDKSIDKMRSWVSPTSDEFIYIFLGIRLTDNQINRETELRSRYGGKGLGIKEKQIKLSPIIHLTSFKVDSTAKLKDIDDINARGANPKTLNDGDARFEFASPCPSAC
ncbi:MAG: hypothetical protein AAF655_21915 [Bacteroidota bacterium]